MSDAIVVINAGSTSLKFGAYAVDAAAVAALLCRGQIDGMQDDPHFVAKNPAGKQLGAHEWGNGQAIDHKTALHFVITWLEANVADMKVVAAGHRVVLGGIALRGTGADRGRRAGLSRIRSRSMEPSHQTFNVRGARALAEAFPGPAAGRLLRQLRSTGRCRRWRRPTRCRRTCATPECATGAITAFPTTTSAGRCRNSPPRRGG